MKVAFFTDTYLPQINGVTKTMTRLIEHMDANGIQYIFFAPQFEGTRSSPKVVRFRSVKFILYPQCRLSIPNYPRVKRILSRFKPDIIHVVTEFNIGLCGLKYAKDNNIPLVSFYETNIPQYLQYYRIKFLENRSWAFFKWFHGRCDKSYCPSTETKKLLASKGLTNFEVWGRGVETDFFSPEKRDEEWRNKNGLAGKLLFTYVGRVSPEKDLDIFIDVAKKLNEKYRNKVSYMIVGEGPSLSKLKKHAPANFHFPGFVRGKALAKIYASSDIFFFPSATETLGFVVLEAMASGLALICCNEGGIIDNLVDGYNGIACREKNFEDFYLAAEKLISDDKLRKTLSHNAWVYVQDKSWDHASARLIENYRNVITQRLERKQKIKQKWYERHRSAD